MFAAQSVQFGQNGCRCHALAVQGNDITLFKFDVEVFGLVRGFFWADSPAPHGGFRFCIRILKVSAFIADVKQIGIHGIGSATLFVFHFDFDPGIFGILEQFFS